MKKILYRIYYGDEVAYIGQAPDCLEQRLLKHMILNTTARRIDRNLVSHIEYAELLPADAEVYYAYYINRDKPFLNYRNKYSDNLTLTLPELEWKEFPMDTVKAWEEREQTRPCDPPRRTSADEVSVTYAVRKRRGDCGYAGHIAVFYYGDTPIYLSMSIKPIESNLRALLFAAEEIRKVDVLAVTRIACVSFKSAADAAVYESYLLHRLRPMNNIAGLSDGEPSCSLPDLEWFDFDMNIIAEWAPVILERNWNKEQSDAFNHAMCDIQRRYYRGEITASTCQAEQEQVWSNAAGAAPPDFKAIAAEARLNAGRASTTE